VSELLLKSFLIRLFQEILADSRPGEADRVADDIHIVFVMGIGIRRPFHQSPEAGGKIVPVEGVFFPVSLADPDGKDFDSVVDVEFLGQLF
jgi:hypothetical protein